jgi:hypothetical protein
MEGPKRIVIYAKKKRSCVEMDLEQNGKKGGLCS